MTGFKKMTLLAILAAVLVSGFVAGCGKQDLGSTRPEHPARDHAVLLPR